MNFVLLFDVIIFDSLDIGLCEMIFIIRAKEKPFYYGHLSGFLS